MRGEFNMEMERQVEGASLSDFNQTGSIFRESSSAMEGPALVTGAVSLW